MGSLDVFEAPGRPAAPEAGNHSAERDAQVVEAVEAFVAASRSPHPPERDEFVRRYPPEIAGQLSDCLAGLAFVQSAAARIVGDSTSDPAPGRAWRHTEGPLTTLGDFQILRELGRGGMGVVYEAVQLSLNRRVALKVLPLAAAFDPRRRERFQIEAQAAAHLQHPHIVAVHAVGCEEGVHFYAMQFIDGCTLSSLIARQECTSGSRVWPDEASTETFPAWVAAASQREAPDGVSEKPLASGTAIRGIPVREVARMGFEAAGALEHAHGLGVVHRDIKPANLLVDARGHLWVADFGLARFVSDPGLTGTDDTPGTLRYMSPEQAAGRGNVVDQRTDIYSLGSTLYELLTLHPAHSGTDRAELLRKILFEEPAPPRKRNRTIPLDLETIVMKAMAKVPDDRYTTSGELASDLGRFLDGQPIRARRLRPLERFGRWALAHRGIVATGIAGILLSLGIAMGVLWHAGQAAISQRNRERLALERTFAALDTIFHPAMGKMASAALLSRDDYEHAIRAYDQIVLLYQNVDGLREIAASASRRSGFYRMILRDPGSDADYSRALAIYGDLSDKHPDFLWLYTREIETLDEYLTWLVTLDRKDEARRVVDRILDIGARVASEPLASKACFSTELGLALNNFTWRLVANPDARAESSRRAAELMQRVVGWWPTRAAYWNTLATARLRAGDLDAAEEAVGAAQNLAPPHGELCDEYLLVLIQQAAGRTDAAVETFDRAEGRMESTPRLARKLDNDTANLRTQAARSLGRKLPPRPAPTARGGSSGQPAGSPGQSHSP